MFPTEWKSVSRRAFLAVAGSMSLGVASAARADEELVRLPTFNEEMDRALRNAPLRMRFQGSTAAELAEWQQKFSTKLRAMLGPHRPPAAWREQRLSRTELPDHTREEWLLESDGVPSLPLYILRPKMDERERRPIVLALHGHGAFGHDSVVGIDATAQQAQAIRGANYDYGRQLVRAGFLVVAPCFTPFGRRISAAQRESKTDPCAVALVRLLYLGQTLLGANLRDALWSLEFAFQRPDALPDRVGCVGLSYGGRMTMVTAALEPRIQVAVISGALNVFQERAAGGGYSCGAQVIPGLLEWGDTPEIGSLIAPRHCIWEIGSRDGLIVPGWAEQAQERLKRAYAAAESSENLQFHRFEGGHQWSGTTALPLLEQRLKLR